jgi:hypothetical protein
MTKQPDQLPPELTERLMKCLRETDGAFEVADMQALLDLIEEHGKEYPQLRELVRINEEAIMEQFLATGEVPPGVKMVGTSREGDKVTRLEVIYGPRSPKS